MRGVRNASLTELNDGENVVRMPDTDPTFTWDHERLTTREDMLVSAAITTFFAVVITQRQVQRGSGQANAQDVLEAERVTLAWAARTFPDLQVRVSR